MQYRHLLLHFVVNFDLGKALLLFVLETHADQKLIWGQLQWGLVRKKSSSMVCALVRIRMDPHYLGYLDSDPDPH